MSHIIDSFITVVERSVDDPFFWIAHVLVVAMLVHVIYNLWNRTY